MLLEVFFITLVTTEHRSSSPVAFLKTEETLEVGSLIIADYTGTINRTRGRNGRILLHLWRLFSSFHATERLQ